MLSQNILVKYSLLAIFTTFILFSFKLKKASPVTILKTKFIGSLIEGENIRLGEKLNFCESCTLFNKTSDHIITEDSCSWESLPQERFCSENDKGPYAVITPLWSGIHNNWLTIFSGLYFAQVWKETGGTVVLSGNAATRKSFSKEEFLKYQPIEISELFDTIHIRTYMKKVFGVNLCIAKYEEDKELADFSSGKATYDEITRFSGLNSSQIIQFNSSILLTPESNASEILNSIPKHSNFILNNNIPWNTKFRYSSPNLEDYHDFHITEMRNAALAICYSKLVRQISVKLLSEIYKLAERNMVVGLHLRIEGDMTLEKWSEERLISVLKEYEDEIMSYKAWTSRDISIYIAHGSLSTNIKNIVDKWVSSLSLQVFRKETLFNGKNGATDIKHFTPEVQAAVDAETLTHLDHFIGYSVSSMSYVVKERRRYHGKTNYIVEPSFQPAFEFWYPIFVPKNHKYLK